MASDPSDPGGQDERKQKHEPDNNMPIEPAADKDNNNAEGTAPDGVWTKENWRLEISQPRRQQNKNSPAMTCLSPMKAFTNFIKTALSVSALKIRFLSLANDDRFIDKIAQIPNESDLASNYSKGALGRPGENGLTKYFLQFQVGTSDTSLVEVKNYLLPYLQREGMWLQPNSFKNLEIYVAGHFTLKHPRWIKMTTQWQAINTTIRAHIQNLDVLTLTPPQRENLEPLLADDKIPDFELHPQMIRAHVPIMADPNANDADAQATNTANQKPAARTKVKTKSNEWIDAECIELHCERPYTKFFVTALESTTAEEPWLLGRFHDHLLRKDSPDSHYCAIVEQDAFLKNTRFIQLHWAHSQVIHSRVHFHKVPQFATMPEPMEWPTLQQFLLSLAGNLPQDTLQTPQFMSMDQSGDAIGIWKLTCHSAMYTDNKDWVEQNFLLLYQATDGFGTLNATSDQRYAKPFRFEDSWDRANRAVLSRASKGNFTATLGHGGCAYQPIVQSRRKQQPRRVPVQVIKPSIEFPALSATNTAWQARPGSLSAASPKQKQKPTQGGGAQKKVTFHLPSDSATVVSQSSTTVATNDDRVEEKLNQLQTDLNKVSEQLTEQLRAQATRCTTIKSSVDLLIKRTTTMEQRSNAVQARLDDATTTANSAASRAAQASNNATQAAH
ncbi:hypothetical protein ACA910_018621 [Epithemia clementina (nom. ined.)]